MGLLSLIMGVPLAAVFALLLGLAGIGLVRGLQLDRRRPGVESRLLLFGLAIGALIAGSAFAVGMVATPSDPQGMAVAAVGIGVVGAVAGTLHVRSLIRRLDRVSVAPYM